MLDPLDQSSAVVRPGGGNSNSNSTTKRSRDSAADGGGGDGLPSDGASPAQAGAGTGTAAAGCGGPDDGESSSLTWRTDPESSYSDWTIRVVHVGTSSPPLDDGASSSTTAKGGSSSRHARRRKGRVCAKRPKLAAAACHEVAKTGSPAPVEELPPRTYHVHKFVLGPGSKYFKWLFERERSESSETTAVSEIHVTNSAAAAAFPHFLDLMYAAGDLRKGKGCEGDGVLQTSNAVALRHLSRRFGAQDAYTLASQFIQRDLSPRNVVAYLSDAELFDDDKVASAAVRRCAERLHVTDPRHVAATYPRDFFEAVLSSGHRSVSSEKLGDHLATYAESDPDFYGGDVFARWTDRERMPHIGPAAAVTFLRADRSGVDLSEDLLERCRETCSTSWEDLDGEDYKAIVPSTSNSNSSSNSKSNMRGGKSGARSLSQMALTEAKFEVGSLRRLCLALTQGGGDKSEAKEARRVLCQERYRTGVLRAFRGSALAPPLKTMIGKKDKHEGALERLPLVIVSGAGFGPLNGRYEAIGKRDGRWVFSDGTFFVVRLYDEDRYEHHWHIMFRYFEDPGFHYSIRENRFYKSVRDGICKRPPEGGWHSVNSCYDPPPEITVIGEIYKEGTTEGEDDDEDEDDDVDGNDDESDVDSVDSIFDAVRNQIIRERLESRVEDDDVDGNDDDSDVVSVDSIMEAVRNQIIRERLESMESS